MAYKFQIIDASRRRPQISNTGDTAVIQAFNTFILTSRPKVLALGPAGLFDSTLEEYSAKGWPLRWPYVNGDDGEVTLDDWSLQTHFPGSRITLDLSVFAAHQTASFWDPAQPALSKLEEMATKMDWTLGLEALQLQDGDASWAAASDVGSDSQVVKMLHWPTYNGRGTYRLLQTASYIADTGAYEYNHVFKEGMTGIEDAAFVSDHRLSLTLSGGGYDGDLPIRVKVTASGTGTPSYRGPAQTMPQNKANLRLYVLGTVYVEHPQALAAQ